MQGIFEFLKSTATILIVILFGGGLYLGYNAGSYNTFIDLYQHRDKLTAEVKYGYHSNIFYKMHRWLSPEEFQDVYNLENNERLAKVKADEQELYWSQHPEEYKTMQKHKQAEHSAKLAKQNQLELSKIGVGK